MSKELPYFRFNVSEWMNDDIHMETYKTKGVFADICAYYWFKDCSITKDTLLKKFSNCKSSIERLLSNNIIKLDKSGNISIRFLDEQYDTLSEKRRLRQAAGQKGGKQKASNAKAMLKQKPSYKDKDKDNIRDVSPFTTGFISTWEQWKDYKKEELNFKFKSSASEKTALKQLHNLSNGSEATAKKIIEQSIANGWKGFFPIKSESKNKLSQYGA